MSIANLPQTGFVRLNQVLQLLPIGRTQWYAGVRSGEYPQAVALGPRARAYRVEDIRALFERLNSQTAGLAVVKANLRRLSKRSKAQVAVGAA